jgi:membrane protein implicated in regulation of membrane protease activity
MILALLITLPLSLVTFPAMYLFAALAVNILGTPDANGHITWVTGIVMGLWFAGLAVANVWVISKLLRARRTRQSRMATMAAVSEPVSPPVA